MTRCAARSASAAPIRGAFVRNRLARKIPARPRVDPARSDRRQRAWFRRASPRLLPAILPPSDDPQLRHRNDELAAAATVLGLRGENLVGEIPGEQQYRVGL